MTDFEIYLKIVGDYHGHICGGIVLGTKLTLAALKKLELEPGVKHKNLIAYVEIDRCMTEAVQVITCCSLGHRSLKYIDYGKFAASFINLDTHEALRASIKESFDSSSKIEELIEQVAQLPDKDIVILQPIKIGISDMDLPGSPLRKAYCFQCGERIMDGREVQRNKKVFCRACANGKYYVEC